MIVSIASGKGGTGKTTVAVNLAALLGDVQFLDCDVEEPNAHIFLKPSIGKTDLATVLFPYFDKTKCVFCGKCSGACQYNAIAVLPANIAFFEHMCHGCGVCTYVCPEGAVTEREKEIGRILSGSAGKINFIGGRMNSGEILSAMLIKTMKELIDPSRTVLIDAPPGTSCQFVSAVHGSDYCILVSEPTPFGVNDFLLAAEALEKLKIPYGLVLNRADIGNDEIRDICARKNIRILMEIPFDMEIARLYSVGEMFLEKMPQYKEKFKAMFEIISEITKK